MAKALTDNMLNALMGATFNPHAHGSHQGAYVNMGDIHGRTRKALHDRGLMHGHYYFTRKGVELFTSLVGNVLDMDGYTWDGDMIIPSVEIMGDDPSDWTPEFDAPTARECFFGHGYNVVAVTVDMYGVTQGLCADCTHRVERSYPLPVNAPETDAESVSEDEPMILVPGRHALDMGTAGYNRFVGIQIGTDGHPFTYGLATAISNMPGMNGTGKTNVETSFGDIITIRTMGGDKRFTVERRKFADPLLTPFTEEHASNLASHTLTDYMVTEGHGVKYECTGCGSIGTHAGMSEFPCDGDLRLDEPTTDDMSIVANLTTSAGINTVDMSGCYGENGKAVHVAPCSQALGTNGPVCSIDDDGTDANDAGFMETEDSEEIREYVTENARKAFLINSHVRTKANDIGYWEGIVTGHDAKQYQGVFLPCAIVTNEGMGALTLPVESLEYNVKPIGHRTECDGWDEYGNTCGELFKCKYCTMAVTTSTGTTHHTTDANGGQWERFEHVLSEGDVVKISRHRGYGVVHATVPGIGIVFVDMGDGHAPSQFLATDVIAL